MEQTLTPADRFQAAAILDHLIYGDAATFQRADAEMLWRLLPVGRAGLLEVRMQAASPGERMRGFAAGMGNVDMRDRPGRTRSFEMAGGSWLRVGQWKLRRVRKRRRCRIEIRQVMGGPMEEGRNAALHYTHDGVPLDLRILRLRRVDIPVFYKLDFRLCFGRFVPWKLPVDGEALDEGGMVAA